MNRVPRITRIAAVAATLIGGGVALALPAGADVSSLSPPAVAAVQVQSPATLIARGVAVNVRLTVVCTPGASGFLNVSVIERVGNDTTRGSSGFVQTAACTGGFQTIEVVVIANDNLFRQGTALASARFDACNNFSCSTSADQREIRIDR